MSSSSLYQLNPHTDSADIVNYINFCKHKIIALLSHDKHMSKKEYTKIPKWQASWFAKPFSGADSERSPIFTPYKIVGLTKH